MKSKEEPRKNTHLQYGPGPEQSQLITIYKCQILSMAGWDFIFSQGFSYLLNTLVHT